MNGPFLLTTIWIMPFAIALASLPVRHDNHRLIKMISLVGNLINFILIVVLTLQFIDVAGADPAATTSSSSLFHFAYKTSWFKIMNIEYNIGVDAISVLMMLLTSIVIFCGILASWNINKQVKEFFILLNVLVAGVYGVFVSLDLFTLFLFYEIAVLPMYLLIGLWGTGRKKYAAMKLTLMLVAGSAFILTGILALYFESGLSTFDLNLLSQVRFADSFQYWAFPIIFLGFGVLGAIFPFHTWSPDGHASAPTAVSMLHAGVLMKLGGYGCLRVGMYLLPEGAHMWMSFFLVLVTINVLYGAFAAIRQTDLKYITAYSSVSHCGLVLFGFTAMTFTGLKGGVLQMISHGLMTALFFCLIGMIYGRTHTRTVSEMGGLMKVMPFLSVAFVIAGFAGLGLPSLSGFVAEVNVFVGSFANPATINRVCTVLAILSIVVTAVYLLRTVNTVVNGPVSQKFAMLSDAATLEKIPVTILLFCLFGMGILPGWIINLVNNAVNPIFNNLMR
ncbi:NAD(P)H-quinone oxidoreductase chain 4 1 [bacterium BMS3Bbin14]|nr:NAD(P)H-quinone oxidoreductase chain 4 1 [bacterium BMS3Abin13]GBE51932.1 NAD(P)H-quinone oxidoreductase chain 4 1 [bacterium BMS3Bbin14]HDK42963.1 NADH-quinone oxidoreductase subunit M [Desulfobacteraceae bacterium]